MASGKPIHIRRSDMESGAKKGRSKKNPLTTTPRASRNLTGKLFFWMTSTIPLLVAGDRNHRRTSNRRSLVQLPPRQSIAEDLGSSHWELPEADALVYRPAHAFRTMGHPGSATPTASPATGNSGLAGRLPVIMEMVLLTMIAFAPWVYGAGPPGFEFLLDAGVSLLVVLWGLRMLLAGEVSWTKCPVSLCLAGLFVLGMWQVTPLGPTVLGYISPATERLYEELLPREPEHLSREDGTATFASGSTLSLYPHATRQQLVRLLAVFLVFAVVRNNLGSTACLRRLAIVAFVNGALLSLFALLQFFSSPPDLLYWTYPTEGRVFGPFMYRNHYACYMNLCIGMGLGLLWSRQQAPAAPDRSRPITRTSAAGWSGCGRPCGCFTTPQRYGFAWRWPSWRAVCFYRCRGEVSSLWSALWGLCSHQDIRLGPCLSSGRNSAVPGACRRLVGLVWPGAY